MAQVVLDNIERVYPGGSKALDGLSLEARLAYGFRSPANQRRRVRTACTRGIRRNQSRTVQGTALHEQPEQIADHLVQVG